MVPTLVENFKFFLYTCNCIAMNKLSMNKLVMLSLLMTQFIMNYVTLCSIYQNCNIELSV